MAGRLERRPFGPFPRGVVDTANAALMSGTKGALRRAAGAVYAGVGSLLARGGSRLVMTLYDDAATPAVVTSVVAILAFTDRALAVAHSTNTNKVYLYVLKADLTGWYNAAGALQSNASAQPIAPLWISTATVPDVAIAEGYGVAYIAHTAAADASTLAFAARKYDPAATALAITSITRASSTATVTVPAAHHLATGDKVTIAGAGEAEYNGTFTVTVTSATTFTYTVSGTPATPASGTITYVAYITNLVSDLDASGASEPLYPRGLIAFQQHLWIFGVGTGTTAANHFRPELARWGQPNFTFPFLAADSFTIGNRVRSDREQIVGWAVAGDALFIGSPFALTRVTGFGRNSWFRQRLDESFGFVGPKCMVARSETLYYWSSQGPMRCSDQGAPEFIGTGVEAAIGTVVNGQRVVAAYDETADVVMFFYDAGSGVRTWMGYDCGRKVWIGPDDDMGLAIRAAGSFAPVVASTAAPVSGPDGAPTSAVTSNVGSTVATAGWTTGDLSAQTQVEFRRQGDSAWTIVPPLPPGVTSYNLTGLTPDVAYEWRAAHLENGTYSAYLGPAAATQFTTSSATLNPPSGLALTQTAQAGQVTIHASWINAGESGVFTEVELETPGGSFVLETTVEAPLASHQMVVTTSGTYRVRIRHTKPNIPAPSSYAGPVSLAVTVSGEIV